MLGSGLGRVKKKLCKDLIPSPLHIRHNHPTQVNPTVKWYACQTVQHLGKDPRHFE